MFRLILTLSTVACVFGIPDLLFGKERIQGGIETEIENVPYQAGFYYNRRLYCGGSIINEKFILTAAHCAVDFLEYAYVMVGNKITNKGKKLGIENMIVHPKYDSYSYDVAIVKLIEPLQFGPTVQPISLASVGDTIPQNSMMLVSGWGSMYYGGNQVQNLRSTKLPYVDTKKCKEYYYDEKIDETMICAGFEQGGTNTCNGDSGGPLVYNEKVVGIVSWAYKCARPKRPSVFANVAHPEIREFITKITGL